MRLCTGAKKFYFEGRARLISICRARYHAENVKMTWLHIVNCTIAGLFLVCYAYQFFYIIYGCIVKPKKYKTVKPTHRYAVMIPARNEEQVVGQLIDSIKRQDYPSELVDIYVVADNCNDMTKDVAESHGAFVYERFNTGLVGKGYSLNYLFGCVDKKCGIEYYDGYFIFDADNLLNSRYITEMDKCFSEGNRIVTSHRNSKNYGTNWITAGYSLWFLREAKLLNNVRTLLGTSCAVSGTGFLICSDIIKRQNGWKHFLLTEDIEFSVDNVIHGEKIAYCDDAYFYDEQPVTFAQSWNQRLRWSRGFLQVFGKYGGRLVKGIFGMKSFSCYDMFMTIAPAFITTVISVIVNGAALAYALLVKPYMIHAVLGEIFLTVCSLYFTLWIVGTISGICEWKNIRCSAPRKIWSFFTFPLFMLTYIPISITALFTKVKWKEIHHCVSESIDAIEGMDEVV